MADLGQLGEWADTPVSRLHNPPLHMRTRTMVMNDDKTIPVEDLAEKAAWRIGIDADPDAPKTSGRVLYERWCAAAGQSAEEKWESLAASIARGVRDPEVRHA